MHCEIRCTPLAKPLHVASQVFHNAVAQKLWSFTQGGKPTCAAYLVVAYLTAAFDQGQNQPEVVPVHQVRLTQKLQVVQHDILHSHNRFHCTEVSLTQWCTGCHYRAQCSGHERTLSDNQNVITAIHIKPQWVDTCATPRRHVWACQMVS